MTGRSAIPRAPSPTPTGNVVEIARSGYNSVRLTVEGTGVVSSRGVTIGGILYGNGQSASVYFGDCKLFLDVADIEVIE